MWVNVIVSSSRQGYASAEEHDSTQPCRPAKSLVRVGHQTEPVPASQRGAETRDEFNVQLRMVQMGHFPGAIPMPRGGRRQLPIPGLLRVRGTRALAFRGEGWAGVCLQAAIER